MIYKSYPFIVETSLNCFSHSKMTAVTSHMFLPELGPVSRKSREAIRQTPAFLFCKPGLLICCKGNKNKNNCKVSCLETPSF